MTVLHNATQRHCNTSECTNNTAPQAAGYIHKGARTDPPWTCRSTCVTIAPPVGGTTARRALQHTTHRRDPPTRMPTALQTTSRCARSRVHANTTTPTAPDRITVQNVQPPAKAGDDGFAAEFWGTTSGAT
eukprot:TRINITY_DN49518_c0_g1_i1.p2 TRINITY_DN49518_c0_g1~~TRINITY_DN49518_c0_g1_i1.p2  ORF type:complete len:138 (+),score=9.22 TRINITY_DN49518_c0_g1_i1:22-414(+)